jgi:phenylalanyl-tRNA synthetase beta chain
VGTYEGKNIPDGKRSVTLRIEYRSDERTLRDEEVEERHRHLIDSLVDKFSAKLH